VEALPAGTPPATVLDLGSGFGFLSMLLAELLPPEKLARIILVDSEFANLGIGEASGKISTEHIYRCGSWRIPLHTLKVDMKKGRALNQLAERVLQAPAAPADGGPHRAATSPALLCGVHLCNTLSLRAAQLFNEHPEAVGLAVVPCCFPTQRHLAQQVVYQLGTHRFAASEFLDSKKVPSSATRFALWGDHILEGIEPGPGGSKALERHALHRPQKAGMFAQDRYVFASRPWCAGASTCPRQGSTGGLVVVDAEFGHAAGRKHGGKRR